MAKKKSKVKESPLAPPSQDKDWEHEHHADTLLRAHEIMADPEKMKGAMKHIKKKKKAFKSVEDLKSYHQEKYGKQGQCEMEDED